MKYVISTEKNQNMQSKIIQSIKILEAEKDIKVLLACETGSRAWGFPSPDSDYDVRLIYMHRKDWYLSLQPKKEHINLMYDDRLIDIAGWDIRKSLNLLYRSNAALLERIQSPHTYVCNDDFRSEINRLADNFYAPIAVMYHYLSLTKNVMEELDGAAKLNLKKLFYALRSSLVCKWVLENSKRPPISIFELIDGLNIPATLKGKIYELIELKSNVNESYQHSQENEILAFIKDVIMESELKANELSGAKNKSLSLNEVFIRWLNKEEQFLRREVS